MKAVSEVIEEKEDHVEIDFPILMKSKSSPMVVLFMQERQGTIVSPVESTQNSLGNYFTDFSTCYDKNFWEPFKGKITLSNE